MSVGWTFISNQFEASLLCSDSVITQIGDQWVPAYVDPLVTAVAKSEPEEVHSQNKCTKEARLLPWGIFTKVLATEMQLILNMQTLSGRRGPADVQETKSNEI